MSKLTQIKSLKLKILWKFSDHKLKTEYFVSIKSYAKTFKEAQLCAL